MFKRIAAAAIAALFWVVPASADYKSEYKAYLAAFDSGDLAAATRFGEAAWRAAESELGDHATTAILAYNYANLISEFQPSNASEAYDRALAITQSGLGSLSIADLKIRSLEAKARASAGSSPKDQRNLIDGLESLLETNADLAAESPDVFARCWRTIALLRLNASQIPGARKAADLAVEFSTTLDPSESRLLAESLILGAVTRLTSRSVKGPEIIESVALLDRAIVLFPPQVDIDSFDRLLALAISWRLSVKPLSLALDEDAFLTGSRLVSREDMRRAAEAAQENSTPDDFFSWVGRSTCAAALDWAKKTLPRFPTKALHKNNVGAIIVGYNVDDTGVEHAVLLSDFPGTGFGEASLAALKEWRLKSPPAPGCRKNHISYFTFEIHL